VPVAFIVGGMVPVLDHAGVAIVGVRVDRPLVVAFRLGPQVGRVERPFVVPRAINLELDGLVGAARLGVTHNAVASDGDVPFPGGVDGDPAILRATEVGGTPKRQFVTRVGDGPQGAVTHTTQGVDANVVHCVVHAPVGGV